MHAVAEAGPAQSGLALGGVRVMTQPRSGGRWQSLDGGRSANDDAVIPRQAPRHEAVPSGKSHEDTLVKMLYEEHAGPLLMFVLRLTGGDRQRAEDIVQETLLRAWRNHERLDESRGSVRSWLFTVARNIVIDEWRTSRSQHELAVAEVPESREEVDRTDQLLTSWLVTEAITSLSADHRAVLLECYYRGASVAQAAHRLGIPEGTVKSRTHYALRALRLALQEMGVGA